MLVFIKKFRMFASVTLQGNQLNKNIFFKFINKKVQLWEKNSILIAIISLFLISAFCSAHSSSKLERIGEPLSIKTVDEKLVWLNITSLLVDKNIIYSTFITKKNRRW